MGKQGHLVKSLSIWVMPIRLRDLPGFSQVGVVELNRKGMIMNQAD